MATTESGAFEGIKVNIRATLELQGPDMTGRAPNLRLFLSRDINSSAMSGHSTAFIARNRRYVLQAAVGDSCRASRVQSGLVMWGFRGSGVSFVNSSGNFIFIPHCPPELPTPYPTDLVQLIPQTSGFQNHTYPRFNTKTTSTKRHGWNN
ncbi:uncharacterized protein PGTG_05150 [Puccinia graminis f. sp. tritici CRL 75-36-700-3]|uniref:Uncharacterized protein n=1 Tax=Puccinia graminis f. sp. tritici (strain CRL 75-36-700-3 / race SCCL) TaxID=418459 RepID=E3K6S5_PUCGT|nr:uncharacterized protein PGTG_05150 [Puccinia graminis f. sp. tritici CRL 75-36-700-3]EFP79925.1 hypothetical protein PGTG_05150 [Puccinia graminis f. sp. tritici CRL 75-36-700-3]